MKGDKMILFDYNFMYIIITFYNFSS